MAKLIYYGILKGTKIVNDIKKNESINKTTQNELKLLDGSKNSIVYKK